MQVTGCPPRKMRTRWPANSRRNFGVSLTHSSWGMSVDRGFVTEIIVASSSPGCNFSTRIAWKALEGKGLIKKTVHKYDGLSSAIGCLAAPLKLDRLIDFFCVLEIPRTWSVAPLKWTKTVYRLQ